MRRRRDWIVVTVIAVLLAAGVVLVGTAMPGATGRASAAGSSPSPWPSPSPGVVLQVGQNGSFVKEYTLADLEAMTPFAGFAGFRNDEANVTGPVAVTGAKVTDIVQDALGAPLAAAQAVDVIGSDGYGQAYSYDQIVNLNGFTLMYNAKAPKNPVALSSFTGPFAVVLMYDDPSGKLMPAGEGPLRLVLADQTSENAVMTGSDSVYAVARLNLVPYVYVKDFSLKLTGLKVNGKRPTRTISRNDFQSCVNCHKSAYWLAGNRWSGVPLYMLVGEVDGGRRAMTYNVALARKGYRIELVSTTGRVRYVSSRTIIDKRNIVIAWRLNGAVLANNLFPLRLMGPGLTTSQKLGRIKSIILLPLKKK